MESCTKTHPWLRFELDLTHAPWQLWILAGEAISKCDHLSGVALGPEAAAKLMNIYLAKGALATTAIEGNTLTEQQALDRVEGIRNLPPSKEYLGIEIDNIIAASNQILQDAAGADKTKLTPQRIISFNAQVLRSLTLDEDIHPGELRTYSVGVADYRGAPAADLDLLLSKLCDWLGEPWIGDLADVPALDKRRLEAILKAIVAHLYLAWIHPFGDGNGRTARLVEFYILALGDIPFPAAYLLSNHYNETRSQYYRQLSMASKTGGNVLPFIHYALRGLVDQLREQIDVVREQQLDLFWQNHVHLLLGDSQAGRRRRDLVMDLTRAAKAVPKSKLTDLSVRVLRHYVGKVDKTLQRDLIELERLGLIERQGESYLAQTKIVQPYLPLRQRDR